MAEGPGYSLVQYTSDHSGYRCGYCKSDDTNYSHGMWAHRMSVQDYQDLIDRGWRRSGKYCYKPTMNKTCCPQYTIKCDALNFKMSKSQKKVLKQVHAYLSTGKCPKNNHEGSNTTGSYEAEFVQPRLPINEDVSNVTILNAAENNQADLANVNMENSTVISSSKNAQVEVFPDVTAISHSTSQGDITRKKIKPGVGRDMSKPPRKKAKLLRRERAAAKMASHHLEGDTKPKHQTMKTQPANEPKSLEEYLNAPLPQSAAHRLEMRLVTALPSDRAYKTSLEASHSLFQKYQMAIHREPELKCCRARYERFLCNSSLQFCLIPVKPREQKFASTYKLSYRVFRDYQMAIHHDPPDECQESSFKNFLVDGPLTPWKPDHGPPSGYGPFHQQYWLDGQLIAVGVLDILPSCVSSVYLYYDPKFSFLSLGTYSSLREIALTRELHRSSPSLRWYYMGFYIHSCPKMRYKGNYAPSYLLCPETFSWVEIDKCVPKLDARKYSRLSDESYTPEVDTDISKIQLFYNGFLVQYGVLRNSPNLDDEIEDELEEYLGLVGAKIASSLLIIRS